MSKVAFLKLKNSSLQDYDKICIDDVHNMIPVVDKEGKAHLLINFYDWEFCMNASTFAMKLKKLLLRKIKIE